MANLCTLLRRTNSMKRQKLARAFFYHLPLRSAFYLITPSRNCFTSRREAIACAVNQYLIASSQWMRRSSMPRRWSRIQSTARHVSKSIRGGRKTRCSRRINNEALRIHDASLRINHDPVIALTELHVLLLARMVRITYCTIPSPDAISRRATAPQREIERRQPDRLQVSNLSARRV